MSMFPDGLTSENDKTLTTLSALDCSDKYLVLSAQDSKESTFASLILLFRFQEVR